MGKLLIRCQACIGTSEVQFYRNKSKMVKFVCKYCHNTHLMPLTTYLEIIGETERSNRVKRYEKTLETDQILQEINSLSGE